jgi:hypothetical protein
MAAGPRDRDREERGREQTGPDGNDNTVVVWPIGQREKGERGDDDIDREERGRE